MSNVVMGILLGLTIPIGIVIWLVAAIVKDATNHDISINTDTFLLPEKTDEA
jgi:hypothetical protein